ncbi:MAG TPA: serine hydrolase domain-containing protein, partial [Nitrospirota bacterium]|nr:serine hydrolase domain-containing protein [Nitrospirota bacterium]
MRSVLVPAVRMFIACIVCTSLLAACASAPIKPETTLPGDYEYAKQYLTWLIKKEMKKFDVTGLSIALVDDQRVVWAEGFGYADKANKVPATPETVYRVGSISKLFTVTAAMQLAEQGRFDIDKPLQTYLPEFSIKSRFPDAGPITPRSIMTHHSGLPSDLIQGMWTKDPEPFTSVASRLTDEYAAYPPNFVFSYSNLAMTLLGHAIEKTSGRDFVSLLDDRVLKPLQMTHSSFAPPGPDGRPLMPKG